MSGHRAVPADLVVMLCFLAVAVACGGNDQKPLPRIVDAISTRDVVRGEALPSTSVRIEFSDDFPSSPGGAPVESFFEFSLPDGDGGRGERFTAKAAAVQRGDPRTVILSIDLVLPEGTFVHVSASAFGRDSEESVDAELEADVTTFQAFFATTRFSFTNPATFPTTPIIPSISESDRNPAVQRVVLEDHMIARREPSVTVSRALTRFDAIPLEIVPSPKLRAALAALTGTFAEQALDFLISEANCTGQPAALIDFQEPPDFPELIARVSHLTDGRLVISIHPQLEGERMEFLMTVLAHEAVHCDLDDSEPEEIIATAFDTLLYSELLVAFPDLALEGTMLARELNVDALAMLNSGRRFPESGGILTSAGLGPALPGSSASQTSFAQFVIDAYELGVEAQSPPEIMALQYASILADRAGINASDPFDLLYADELISRSFSQTMISGLIRALELEPI